ncbi:E3 ubiquitin-protein ligase RNF4-like isoform X1 [Zingiber officinale]|uniref:E3 ubiquitin-protein ligase RNF4-like isoform X1 n=1 Tax=Zingiber officinale TaxID=94328 RepID=UPI001C4C9B30|nr:E3 ubiquitin-protein ligase RNF4-like isoform X1 [Zingiber officinale]
MVLHLDLNSLPVESHPSEGTSAVYNPCHATGPQQGSCTQPIPLIDADELEDEVVALSSSIDFSTGRSRTKRTRPVIVILDDDLELNMRNSVIVGEQVASSSLFACKRPFRSSNSRTSIDRDPYIDLEDGHDAKRKRLMSPEPEPQPAKVIVKPYTCLICMEELVEAASTICGHIFCMTCTKTSIRTQKKCPTCRRKLNMRNFHRVYLPH